jgi:hypothetical protein
MPDVFGEDIADWLAFLATSVVPQSPQKRLLGGFSAPHFGQWLVSGAPQSPQNLFPAGLSLPHFEQRISSPWRTRFAPHLSPAVVATIATRPEKAIRSPAHRTLCLLQT